MMKKLFTLSMVVAFAMTLSAQSPRMGFVEEATQASCPPCAQLNPALQDLMNANSDKVIFMAYQVWWPGFDQMYLDNQEDIDTRVGEYYDFSFAPQLKMQGAFPAGGDGGVTSLTQQMIDDNYAEMSEFSMDVAAAFEDGILSVTGNITGTAPASGTFKLHLVLTEGTIYSTQATGGTNGETEYHHVMKKFLPGIDGITLAGEWADGDSYVIDETYDLSDLTIYNYGDMEVIAFIQNDDDKFIHQAAKDGEVEVTVSSANNGGAVDITGLPGLVCSGEQTLSPEVTFQNTGNEPLTSIDFEYSVNGGDVSTYSWSSADGIATLATETITLPAITFMTAADNELTVELSNPNGMEDEDASDNLVNASIALATDGGQELTLTIVLDEYPEETAWEFLGADGSVVASSNGTYASEADGATVVEEFVAPLGCSNLVVTDSYGDGLNGAQWGGTDGSFTLTDSDGTVLVAGGGDDNFSVSENVASISIALGIEENAYVTGFSVSPNPTSDILNVRFDIANNAATSVSVMNAIGQTVIAENFGSLQGQYTEQLDLSELNNGMYYVTILSGGETATVKVVLTK